ncbi:hypothetical protein CBER1_04487 [Lecanosticta acicola]|uniref:DUF7704 domain-containing protein n=1 Tax=Lecanosticta acicola TaxID=111012 RepID=A0AAI9E9C0_9PEZI|nr:hypothetical protein CBER1_04487 [Lecanosticta acicola]
MATVKASTTIPYLYRFLLTNVESLLALGGVALVLMDPGKYNASLTQARLSTIQPDTQFIYTQLAGGWAFIAFTEAVVLRLVDDLRVWKLLCAGILFSDALYTHSIAQAAGGWTEWFKVGNWSVEDWLVGVTTWPFVLTRLAIVLGVGLRKADLVKRA